VRQTLNIIRKREKAWLKVIFRAGADIAVYEKFGAARISELVADKVSRKFENSSLIASGTLLQTAIIAINLRNRARRYYPSKVNSGWMKHNAHVIRIVEKEAVTFESLRSLLTKLSEVCLTRVAE
jgi:hypothetical protein